MERVARPRRVVVEAPPRVRVHEDDTYPPGYGVGAGTVVGAPAFVRTVAVDTDGHFYFIIGGAPGAGTVGVDVDGKWFYDMAAGAPQHEIKADTDGHPYVS